MFLGQRVRESPTEILTQRNSGLSSADKTDSPNCVLMNEYIQGCTNDMQHAGFPLEGLQFYEMGSLQTMLVISNRNSNEPEEMENHQITHDFKTETLKVHV